MGRSFKGGQIEEMEPIIGAGNLNNQLKRANSILAPGEKHFTQQELNDMVQYLMVNRANNSEHVKIKKSSRNELHIGFLFASPLVLRDKSNFKTQHFSKNIDQNKVKNALVSYYHKE